MCLLCVQESAQATERERERRNLAILCAAFIHWMKREKQKYFLAKRKFSCVFACECTLCVCVCILVCLPFVCVQIAHKFCSIVLRRKAQANPQDFHFWPLIAALWTAANCFFWGYSSTNLSPSLYLHLSLCLSLLLLQHFLLGVGRGTLGNSNWISRATDLTFNCRHFVLAIFILIVAHVSQQPDVVLASDPPIYFMSCSLWYLF